jgi:hypothetical protein
MLPAAVSMGGLVLRRWRMALEGEQHQAVNVERATAPALPDVDEQVAVAVRDRSEDTLMRRVPDHTKGVGLIGGRWDRLPYNAEAGDWCVGMGERFRTMQMDGTRVRDRG